jgi:peptidoglycan/LPS O-acetylase OafA/YrhL/Tfp pilus assembly protein PilF
MSRRQEYFAELTGVRALAAWAVFNYHFNMFDRAWCGETVFRLCHEMYLGVNVFYVLSGFLIYYRYADELTRFDQGWLAQFARNRFARIYPVYFLLLTITYLWVGFPDARATLATFTLTQAYFPDLLDVGIPQAWTLTIEETFYFSAPLLFWLARRGTVAAPVLLMLTVGFALGLAPGSPYYGHLGHVLGRTLFGTIGCFGAGMILARFMLRRGSQPSAAGHKRPWITFGALAALTLLVLYASHLGHTVEPRLEPGVIGRGRDHPQAWALLFLVFPALVAVFFYGLITERSLIKRLLGSPLFVLLGNSSYCFYLIHLGVIQNFLLERGINPALPAAWRGGSAALLILFVLLNLLSIAIYLSFEKPVGAWIKSWGDLGAVPRNRLHRGAYVALATALLVTFAMPVVLRYEQAQIAVARLLSEDGVYESIEAVLCFAAASLLIIAVIHSGANWLRRAWLGLGALALIGMVGEELSWGQRLLNLSTPAWLAARNHQGELSLHNLDLFQPADEGNRLQVLWLLAMLIYLGAMPLAARASSTWRGALDRLQLPIPSMPLCIMFLAALTIHMLDPRHSEVLELALDLILFAFAWEIAAPWLRSLAPAARRAWLIGVAAPTIILAIALWTQAGKVKLPTVESLELAAAARADISIGQRDTAQNKLRKALSLWPQNTQAHFDLAQLLSQSGDHASAAEHLRKVVADEPANLPARVQLATLLAQIGDMQAAVAELQTALAQKPDSFEIATNLAWILATANDDQVRDGAVAVQLAEEACRRSNFEQPLALNALAAAYAEAGRFDDAEKTARRAYDVAIASNQVGLATRIRERQRQYESRQPWREGD